MSEIRNYDKNLADQNLSSNMEDKINDRMVLYYMGNIFVNHVEDFEYYSLPNTSSFLNNIILKIEDFYKWDRVINIVSHKIFEVVYDFEGPYLHFLGFNPSYYYKKDYRFGKLTDKYVGCQRSKNNYIKFQNEMIENGYENQSKINTTFISIVDSIYDNSILFRY